MTTTNRYEIEELKALGVGASAWFVFDTQTRHYVYAGLQTREEAEAALKELAE